MKESPEFWNKIWGKSYRIGIKKHAKLYLELRQYLNGKILDLACGVTNLYDGKQYDITGVDQSSKAIEIMKQKYPLGTFIVMDIFKVDFPTETFDTVILSSIIEHFENFNLLLVNAKRFLKKNGTIVIVVPQSHHFRTHVHCKWDEDKIEKEIGGVLGKISYYLIQLPHGKEWVVIYKGAENQ